MDAQPGPVTCPRTTQAPHYLPALDGLRAISILLVLMAHAGLGQLVPGGLGVTIFFAISGFLITRQIDHEIARTGRLDLGQFYARRFLRLAPALLAYVALATPLAIQLGAGISPGGLLAALFYLANYWWLYVGYPHGTPFPILWSLAVEEHYYAVFPLAMAALLPKPRALIRAILALCALALLWRLALATACGDATAPSRLCGLPPGPDTLPGARLYLATDTRFDAILAGALAALLAPARPGRAHAWSPWAGAMLLLPALAIRVPLFRDTLRYTLESAASALLVHHIAGFPHGPLATLLSTRPLRLVGKLSYSLYLYHFVVSLVILRIHGPFDWRSPAFYLYFALSFLLATASYVLVERPMLRLRRRCGAQAGTFPTIATENTYINPR
jgi:peptidoglycan/LPS O-acetylase OafA/YrhL